MNKKIEQFSKLHKLGYNLTPLYAPDDNSVPPALRGKAPKSDRWQQTVIEYAGEADFNSIYENSNAGWVIPGNCVVLDCDVRNFATEQSRKMPLVFIKLFLMDHGCTDDFINQIQWYVKTGNGFHFYFQLPDDIAAQVVSGEIHLKNSIEAGIELKHIGQQVAAPGSIHPLGPIYTPYMIGDFVSPTTPTDIWPEMAINNLPRLPHSFIDHFISKVESFDLVDADITVDNPQNIAKVEYFLSKREPAIEGENGDLWTFKTIAKVLEFGISTDKAEELLHVWNETCLPPWSDDDLHNKIINAWKYMANNKAKNVADAQFTSLTTDQLPEHIRSQIPTKKVEAAPVVNVETDAAAPADDKSDIANLKYGKNQIANALKFVLRCYPNNSLLFNAGYFYKYADGVWTETHPQSLESEVQRELAAYPKVDMALITNTLRAVKNITTVDNIRFPGERVEIDGKIDTRFNHDWLLNMSNGVLDLFSHIKGEPESKFLRPHSSSLLLRGKVNYKYQKGAQCPKWLEFLDQTFPNDKESIDLLQQWMGYCLTNNNSRQKFMVMFGVPRSGKSTIMSVMESLIGPFDIANTSLQSLSNDFGLADLLYRKCSFLGDVQEDGLKEYNNKFVQLIKNVTGNSPVSVNIKHREAKQELLYNRFTLATNNLPDWFDSSGAFGNRMLLLTFTITHQGKENWNLLNQLREELSGILNWSLEGLKQLELSDRFVVPKSSLDHLEEYDRSSSPIRAFVNDNCLLKEGAKVTVNDLFDRYKVWCDNNNLKAYSKIGFCKRLRGVVPDIRTSQWKADGSNMVRGYYHLELISE